MYQTNMYLVVNKKAYCVCCNVKVVSRETDNVDI